jgi:phosphoribosylanthranilate isomerase
MFHIKICGLTTVDDAMAAIEAGADALGLNFHPSSPRYVTPSQAAAIVQAVRKSGWRGTTVAVVVQGETTLLADPQLAGIDAWQLHGNQSPAELVAFRQRLNPSASAPPPGHDAPGTADAVPPPAGTSPAGRWRLIRALALRGQSLDPVTDYWKRCAALGGLPDALLLDAFQEGMWGGTGKFIDWDAVNSERASLGEIPLILAGGLTPHNVAAAIRHVRPVAVDVASGVEASPGRKDAAKLRDFVAAARQTFQEIGMLRQIGGA